MKYRNFPLTRLLARQVEKLARHLARWHAGLKH